jgi:uncharacterized protein with PQ loop repeat
MKKAEITFQESQKLGLWVRLLMIAICLFFIFGCIYQIILGKPWGNNPASDTPLIIVTVLLLLVTVGLFLMKMQTIVNNDGVSIKMFPFHFKYKFFPWDTIEKSYIRQYKPIAEYGGWGFRSSMIKVRSLNIKFIEGSLSRALNKSIAYNMSGNIGLQLELVSGQRILIGTHKPVELAETLRELGKLSE